MLNFILVLLIGIVSSQTVKQIQSSTIIDFGSNIQYMSKVLQTHFLIQFSNSTISIFGPDLQYKYSFSVNNGMVFDKVTTDKGPGIHLGFTHNASSTLCICKIDDVLLISSVCYNTSNTTFQYIDIFNNGNYIYGDGKKFEIKNSNGSIQSAYNFTTNCSTFYFH